MLAVVAALLVGVPLGLAGGYFRAADAVISRLTDLLLAFPFLIMAVGLAAIRGASLGNAAIAIGVAQVPGVVRVSARHPAAEVARLRRRRDRRRRQRRVVLARHVLPNATSAILVQATVAIPRLSSARRCSPSSASHPAARAQPRHHARRASRSPPERRGRRDARPDDHAAALAFNVFSDALRDALYPKANR